MREWDGIAPTVAGPPSICFGFTGYVPERDQFITGLSLHQQDTKASESITWDKNVHAYSFTQKKWETVGQISEAIQQHIQIDLINRMNWFQAGRYFILKHYEKPYATFLIVDAVKNEARLWADTPRVLTWVEDNSGANSYRTYTWRDTLYLHVVPTNNYAKPTPVLKMPVAKIWREAKPIGTFYEANDVGYSPFFYGYLAVGIAFVLMGLFIWRKRQLARLQSARQPTHKPTVGMDWSAFTQQERDVLTALTNITDDGFTNDQLHSLLSLEEKSLDNQRKIRAEFLKSLNVKLKLRFGVDEAIQRVPMASDRRMFSYQLHPDVLEAILNAS